MTIPRPDGTGSPATAPPPQCPAHAGLDDVRQRMYGPETDAPYDLYRKMRGQHGQVAPVLLPGDVPAWFVLGHRENLNVMRTPSLWSCDSRIWNVRLPMDSPLLPITAWQPLMVFADGDEHARLRAAVVDALGRFNRHGIRRYVGRYTQRLVDQFAHIGRADLVKDFAEPLSALVLSRQCGVHERDALAVGAAVRDMVKGTETALQSNEFVVSVMTQLVRSKKEQRGDDLASWLLAHESNLSDQEVIEHLRHAIVAAHENTVNLIVNTLRTVLIDQRFRARLSGGSMTLPDALDQVMWDAPPMSVGAFRFARRDTMLGDQAIKAGDMVMLGLAAGNVDPEIRPDLDVPVHGNRSHLAFSGGPHQCPGQDIGRGIAETGIDSLLAQLPNIQLAVTVDELNVTSSLVSSRLESLPVAFVPVRPKNSSPEAASGSQPMPAAATPEPAPFSPSPVALPWWRRLLGGRAR